MRKKKKKVGRNDKCPCGSGQKYKKCHLGKESQIISDDLHLRIQEMEAKEFQRKEQQGLGKPILSTNAEDVKYVAVGSELLYSKNWKTFLDFLQDYIVRVLGREWGAAEFEKNKKERHPIVSWNEALCKLQRDSLPKDGTIGTIKETGAASAYIHLAYYLYLVRHNVGIQTELIRRLKLNNLANFYGAFYEAQVAANFIKAGFELEFEDELDRSSSHCEFTATHKETGRKFSVEAKTLAPKVKKAPFVASKLRSALKKEANYERVVFLEISKPAKNEAESKELLIRAIKNIRELETNPKLDGNNLPPAYVFITNNSFWHALDGYEFPFALGINGFKMPSFDYDYGTEKRKDTVHNALIEREKNKEMLDLAKSIKKYQNVPSTFDGENPELIGEEGIENEEKLVIGKKYLVPTKEKGDVVGVLHNAFVDEQNKVVDAFFNLVGGGVNMVRKPLSDEEIAAYKRHPQTYFGKVMPKTKCDSPLEFYDWVYKNYKNTSKENLLKMMKEYPNIEELKKLPQEELVKIYCENVTNCALQKEGEIKDEKS